MLINITIGKLAITSSTNWMGSFILAEWKIKTSPAKASFL
jgi:hypothetical protein